VTPEEGLVQYDSQSHTMSAGHSDSSVSRYQRHVGCLTLCLKHRPICSEPWRQRERWTQ
jgi:hypothetical protein